ncbi:hypothetical protein, partial [Streptomyces sp. 840.1]|uniref:hypothetical protein n=1 Tax=Streptomyces sp. 840.1 TaxID=2485152 RepID=UPI001C840E5B
ASVVHCGAGLRCQFLRCSSLDLFNYTMCSSLTPRQGNLAGRSPDVSLNFEDVSIDLTGRQLV